MNSAAEWLPDDMAMAILLKLPVKTLIRFRCISKSMSAAIRSARFVERHLSLQRQNSNPRILVRVDPMRGVQRKPYLAAFSGELLLTENIQMPFYHVTGPCNGLICLRVNEERVAIWNPATRELKYVPSPIPRRPEVEIREVCLGFDSRSGEYKVIVLLSSYFDREKWNCTDRVQLYSLSSNSWREIHVPVMRIDEWTAFYDQKNDRVLWVGRRENRYQILPFNMRNESFSSIPLPEFEGDLHPGLVFVEHPGADIALIAYPAFEQEICFDLWVKKEVWTREWCIGPFHGIDHLLGLWKSGQMLLESYQSELLLLNVESGEMKSLGVFQVADNLEVIVFVESLVPILGCTEKEKKKCKRSSSSSSSDEMKRLRWGLKK